MKIQIFLSLLLITTEVLASASDCSRREDPLAHLSGLARLTCERAIAAGYSLEETGCANATTVSWAYEHTNIIPLTSSNPADRIMSESMGILTSQGISNTQATQVCPGVYLVAAHGLFGKGESESSVIRNRLPKVDSYPYRQHPSMKVQSIISPRLDTSSGEVWDNHQTDYAFIRVENPVFPDSFALPVQANAEQVIEIASENGATIYRSESIYRRSTDSYGIKHPDFDSELLRHDKAEDVSVLEERYSQPYKLNRNCLFQGMNGSDGLVKHNCPTENGVSGSSIISVGKNNKPYVLGLHTRGSEQFIANDTVTNNTMISPSSYCADYEEACGRPCAQKEELNSIPL